MTSEFANYAFISYSHRDEKWAAWIQRKLEAYRLPSVIRKEAGSTIPERIRPVFRDATDLGAGRLRNNLQKELETSRFLIVVCSPNSATPNAEGKHWVNDEVTHFASLGWPTESSLDGNPYRATDGTLGWDKTYDEYGKELSKNDVR